MHAAHARFLSIALALALPMAASADTLFGDLPHSSAEFVVTHLTISNVHGTIPITSWQTTTKAGLIPQSIDATLDARSIDTHDADRDKDLRGADWFEVEKYPTIEFKSTKVTPAASGTFTALGNLTLHGVTKTVKLNGQLLGNVVDNRGRTHVGYTASTTIDRRTFNLTWGQTTPAGQLIVGNDVRIDIQAEGILKK